MPFLARHFLLDVASTIGLVQSSAQRPPRFEPTSEPGVFIGYHFQPGMKWKKEIVVLPIKELNRNDFHECLKPVLASQFSVPEGVSHFL